jgi:hypothetical protein
VPGDQLGQRCHPMLLCIAAARSGSSGAQRLFFTGRDLLRTAWTGCGRGKRRGSAVRHICSHRPQ